MSGKLKNKIIILFILVCVGLILYLFVQKNEQQKTEIKPLGSELTVLKPNLQQTVTLSQSNSSDQNLKSAQITSVQFENWIESEVQRIEVPTKSPIDYQFKVQDFVNKLGPLQIEVLKQKTLNSEGPINERIFANYALLQFVGSESNTIIFDLIGQSKKPVSIPQPHSEAEVRRGQEYALQYMRVDELAKRADGGDVSAREYLIQLAENFSDLKIKSYAQRKLDEILHK